MRNAKFHICIGLDRGDGCGWTCGQCGQTYIDQEPPTAWQKFRMWLNRNDVEVLGAHEAIEAPKEPV